MIKISVKLVDSNLVYSEDMRKDEIMSKISIAKIGTIIYVVVILIVFKDMIGQQALDSVQLVFLLMPIVSALIIISLEFVRSHAWNDSGYLYKISGLASRFSIAACSFMIVLRVGLNYDNALLAFPVPLLVLVAAIFEVINIMHGRKR